MPIKYLQKSNCQTTVPNMRLKPKSERHSMKGVLCMSE